MAIRKRNQILVLTQNYREGNMKKSVDAVGTNGNEFMKLERVGIKWGVKYKHQMYPRCKMCNNG